LEIKVLNIIDSRCNHEVRMYFIMLLYVCVISGPSRNQINEYLAVLI